MKLPNIVLIGATLAICSTSSAYAHDNFSFGLSIGAPIYAPPPAVYYPAPPTVYYSTPPAVYYSPAPRIYYESPYPRAYFRYYDDDHRHHGWGRGEGWGHRGWR